MLPDVIIIGAGASGLMCAATAAERGKRVLLLEHSRKIAQKLAISGGGRCNFTNINVNASHYFCGNPHFVKSALARFTPEDIISLFDRHGIKWVEKEDRQLFCKRSAAEVVQFFAERLLKLRVQVVTGCEIESVSHSGGFAIKTTKGIFETDKLVVASGGLSYSKLGASDIGYKIGRQFGHRVVSPVAGLAPLLWNEMDRLNFSKLAGISKRAVVQIGRRKFSGGLLFTHEGLSGPVILNASLVWRKGDALTIDLFDADIWEILNNQYKLQTKKTIQGVVQQMLPKRLSEVLCKYQEIPKLPVSALSERKLKGIADKLKRLIIFPEERGSFDHAEVTLGGIDTAEISSKTMESKMAQGLYFIGEVLDVTGMLGGYNLHWAWSSGFVAGSSL